MSGSPRDASSGVPAHVREARPSDCTGIAEIYNEAIRSGRATMDTEHVEPARYEGLLSQLSPRECLLVATTRSGVAGWGIVKGYSDRPGYAIACETSVYVAEAQQGRGVGSRLLEALVARTTELGYRHLVAKIMGVNDRSIAFHEGHGYEIVGRQRNIGRLHGISHDVVIMQRLLPDAALPGSEE